MQDRTVISTTIFLVQTKMEWWKYDEPLPLNILATKDLMACWGRIPHGQK